MIWLEKPACRCCLRRKSQIVPPLYLPPESMGRGDFEGVQMRLERDRNVTTTRQSSSTNGWLRSLSQLFQRLNLQELTEVTR
jgi:hypothetical protein